MKIFDSVNLWYEKNTCDVHTKTAVLNAQLLHDSVHYLSLFARSYFKAEEGGLLDHEELLSTCLPMQVIT